jgi:hypothetical protein
MTSDLQDLNDPIMGAISKEAPLWEEWKKKADGKKILIATSMTGYIHGSSMDRVLALALTEKGHQVAFLLCDSDLEACQIIKFSSYKPEQLMKSVNTPRCSSCAPHIDKLFAPLGLPIFNFKSDRSQEPKQKENFLNMSFEELKAFQIGSVKIGMHAWAGAVRYFASTQFAGEPDAKEILIRFLVSGIRLHDSTSNVINEFKPDTLIAHHGIYIPQGVVSEVARENQVSLMTWTSSYRKGTFIFSPDETYHYSMVTEPTSNWEELELTKKQLSVLDKYMNSRWRGDNDWIKFSDSKVDQSVSKKRKSDFFLALTSVTWDAELHYESRAFSSMRDWLAKTVEYFTENPTLQLIIRVHPAEVTSPNKSRESMFDYVNSLKINLPPNIELIAATDKTSTYELIEKSRAVIVYNTKTGIEAAYRNKPVIIAGESWLRGKGIGWDVTNTAHYFETLNLFKDRPTMTFDQLKRAERYAFHFFFRRMIRISLFSDPYSIDWLFPKRNLKLSELVGSNDLNFQKILDAIDNSLTPLGEEI